MRGDRRAYDRGITIFSPDGRLYQVEYAREAVEQGAPCVGVRAADGVVLAAHAPRRSHLVDPRSVEKLHAVDDHVAVASAGHAADARRLVEVARRAAQRERLRYGEPATVEALSTAIADHVQEHTQTGGARPYGAALLVAGHDGVEPNATGGAGGAEPRSTGPATPTGAGAGAPRLFETDPSGATTEWRATAVGGNASTVVEYFEDAYDAAGSLDDAVDLALAGLVRAAGEPPDPRDVRVGTVDEAGYGTLAGDAVRTALESAAGS